MWNCCRQHCPLKGTSCFFQWPLQIKTELAADCAICRLSRWQSLLEVLWFCPGSRFIFSKKWNCNTSNPFPVVVGPPCRNLSHSSSFQLHITLRGCVKLLKAARKRESRNLLERKSHCILRGHDYRAVELDLTPEIEVFHLLFETGHTKNRKKYIKLHIKYINFRCLVQLYHPVFTV